MGGPPVPAKKKGGCGKIILIVFLILLLLGIIGGIVQMVLCFVCAGSSGGGGGGGTTITLTEPATGTMGPGTSLCTVAGLERACFEYTFVVETAGRYQFSVTRTTGDMDCYLVVLREDGTEVGHDDDSAGYPNSQLVEDLQPGTYRIQAAHLAGAPSQDSNFTVAVVQVGGAAGGTPPAAGGTAPATGGEQPAAGGTPPATGGAPPTAGGTPPASGGACDRLAACCGTSAVSAIAAYQSVCSSVPSYRTLPGGGDSYCQSGLQGIQTYFTAPGVGTLPTECQ
jgi:hypothetical protein